MFSDVSSENAALSERLMEIHSHPPILYYGFKGNSTSFRLAQFSKYSGTCYNKDSRTIKLTVLYQGEKPSYKEVEPVKSPHYERILFVGAFHNEAPLHYNSKFSFSLYS